MALTRYGYKNFQDEEDFIKPGRFFFNQSQKDRLHQEFRKNKNPSTEWRQEIAEELQVPVKKVHMWFGARRQKDKLAQEKKLRSSPVGKVSIQPVSHALPEQYSAPVHISKAPYELASDVQNASKPSELQKPVLKTSDYYEPIAKPIEPLYSKPSEPLYSSPNTSSSPYSDFNSNLEKEREALEKLDARDIAKHFLNLGKKFSELKNLFDQTEANIKSKVQDEDFKPHKFDSKPVSNDEVEASELWIENDPSVPKGWSTKLNKNGSRRAMRKIFRDPSGRIFYSRRQAVNDMIQKKTYTEDEIRIMESYYNNVHQEMETQHEPEPVLGLNHSFKYSDGIVDNFSDQVAENKTEWNENDPGLPKGWKSKEHNGLTMVKGPPPSNDMYLSRVAAYRALLNDPSANIEEIKVFRKSFEAAGTNIESELATVEDEWKVDLNLPHGWKYTHTMREATNRKSGYKRLLSFLTERGTKLNSSLIALEYMSDAGYSNHEKDKLRSFINETKLNQKKKAEQLKTNQSPAPPNSDQNSFAIKESLEKNEPTNIYPGPYPYLQTYDPPQNGHYPEHHGPVPYSEHHFPQFHQPNLYYPPPHSVPPYMPPPHSLPQYQYPPHHASYQESAQLIQPSFPQQPTVPQYPQLSKVYETPEELPQVDETKIKTEPLEAEQENKQIVTDNLEFAKLLAEGLIKIEVEETETEEAQDLRSDQMDEEESIDKVAEPLADEEAMTQVEESMAQVEEPLVQVELMAHVAETLPQDEELIGQVEEPRARTEELMAQTEELMAQVEEPLAQVESMALVTESMAQIEEPLAQFEELIDQVKEPASVSEEPIAQVHEPKSHGEETTAHFEEPRGQDEEMRTEVEEENLNFEVEEPSIKEPFTPLEEPMDRVQEPVALSEEVMANDTQPTDHAVEANVQTEETIKITEEPMGRIEEALTKVDEEMTTFDEEMTNVENERTQAVKPNDYDEDEDLTGLFKGPIRQVEGPMPHQVKEPMHLADDVIAKEDQSTWKAGEKIGKDSKPVNKEPSLQFGFYNDESFIKKVAFETNGTIYKTALYDDTIDNDRYKMSENYESSLLIKEDEEVIPSHLSEHNYTFPQERDPENKMTTQQEKDSELQAKKSSQSKVEETVLLNETSLLYEADEIDSSCFTESVINKSIPVEEIDNSTWYDGASPVKLPAHFIKPIQEDSFLTDDEFLVTQYDNPIVAPHQLENVDDFEQVSASSGSIPSETVLQNELVQGNGWTNGSLDDTRFESDEEELDAIQNMINTGNGSTLNENMAMEESIKEEEEINDFIQEFALLEKENAKLEEANKSLEVACKELNCDKDGLENNADSACDSSDNLCEEFDDNRLLQSDDNDLCDDLLGRKYFTEKTLDEKQKGERYEQDPFLPEGWKKATYFVKKTGMKLYRYLSPDGQKFTSRKLVVSFMKSKGFSQEELDRAMEGTKTKRIVNKSDQDNLGEQVLDEPSMRRVRKEVFITNEGHKRKLPTDDLERRGRPRKELENEVIVKREPNSESILEPVTKEAEDESSIGPKLSVSRNAFKQLAALFLKSPIPSNADLGYISRSTSVSAKDVKWWFIKIRHRVKIHKVEKEQVKNYLDSIRICHDTNGIISL